MQDNQTELTPEQINLIKQKSKQQIDDRKFRVSIVGQTGVGKSSLINALFGTQLKTDAVEPCTKFELEGDEIPAIPIKKNLYFYDLPGIGESDEADEKYLQKYREHLQTSDVVLWAIHADNRSVVFDLQSFKKIMAEYTQEQKALLMGKLIFILTKADVLHPPSWIAAKTGNIVQFLPSPETSTTLKKKSDYYQNIFIKPYGNLIVSKTYNDCNFFIEEDGFEYDQDLKLIFYKGFMSIEKLEIYKNKYPQYEKVFQRIYDNYQVIPCSAVFRYNFNKLILVILNKLGYEAVIQFQQIIAGDSLDRIPFDQTENMCNLLVYEPDTKKTLFEFSRWLNTHKNWKFGL